MINFFFADSASHALQEPPFREPRARSWLDSRETVLVHSLSGSKVQPEQLVHGLVNHLFKWMHKTCITGGHRRCHMDLIVILKHLAVVHGSEKHLFTCPHNCNMYICPVSDRGQSCWPCRAPEGNLAFGWPGPAARFGTPSAPCSCSPGRRLPMIPA